MKTTKVVEEKKNKFIRVETIKKLNKLIFDEQFEFFILLVGGCRSSKTITEGEYPDTYDVLHEMDDTYETLTRKEFVDSNIGTAMKAGNFYCFNFNQE